MASTKVESRLCVYCQRVVGTHPDHVPPKSYFAPPRPSNLITVPCCRSCNQSFVVDDEYLKTVIAMRSDIVNDPKLMSLQEWLKRSWKRPESRRLRERLLRRSTEAVIRTKQGIVLGKAPVFVVERERVERVLSRYVRALYYHETGERLPSTIKFTHHLNFEVDPAFQANLPELFGGRHWRSIGDNEFKYIWNRASDQPLATVWLLAFYDRVPFFAFATPPLGDSRTA